MPTARLPDINTSIIRYRGVALDSYLRLDPEPCLMALHSVNAQLGDETDSDGNPKFRVIVNDRIYRDRTRHEYIVHCPHCPATHARETLPLRTIYLPPAVRILTGRTTAEVWRCEACKRDSRLSACDVEDRHMSEPYYCGAVPSPPVRKPGLRGRTPFLTEFRHWASMYIIELEAKAASYRDAHWKRDDDELDLGAGVTMGPALEQES